MGRFGFIITIFLYQDANNESQKEWTLLLKWSELDLH